ncbi:serine/threonine protein kinase [Perlucidibaca aquatica]|uniref:serine/threonine protein kinase n=1 Tax=Perlucidibaca aquatica TaxID=1852776 RepID=UPI00083A7C2A|nr:serine/threonine protein kinase [Perlucidibaca aquatica]
MTQDHAGQSFSDYARLSPDLVIDAIEHTGRLSDARVFALNSYENRVYQVGIEDELPLVAKFYRPGRWSDAQIREEHSFTRELAAAELPVIAPIANDDGETLFGYGDYRFALFLRKGGQGLEAGDLDQLHRVGMLLGRVHQIGRQQAFSHRPVLDIERYLTQPVCRVEARLPAHLLAAYRTVITQLQVLIQASGLGQLRHIRTQGDTHPGNILWTRDDGPWLLDFDDCQSAPAVQDLWMLLSGSRPEQELQLAELLDGYQMFCDFDARELACIEALRSLRMIHYAGWLALRWEDPAFPAAFPWFDTPHYWQTHIGELQMQIERMGEPPLRML